MSRNEAKFNGLTGQISTRCDTGCYPPLACLGERKLPFFLDFKLALMIDSMIGVKSGVKVAKIVPLESDFSHNWLEFRIGRGMVDTSMEPSS